MPNYEIKTKKGTPLVAACLRDTVADYRSVGPLYDAIVAQFEEEGWTPAGPSLALYYDEGYKERDVDVEAAIPVAGVTPGRYGRVVVRELPVYDQVASLTRRGPWNDFTPAYNAIMDWVKVKGFRMVGPNREIYLKGPSSGAEPSDYLVEIQFPVAKID